MSSTKVSSIVIMLLGFIFSLTVRADESSSALTFKNWKEQQILGAQNQLLRAGVDLEANKKSTEQSSKSTKKSSTKAKALDRFKVSSARSKLEKSEFEYKQAQEGLKAANELNMEDYVSLYLPTLSGQPQNVERLVEQLSKEELSKILAEMLKKQSDQRDSLTKFNPKVGQVLAAETRSQP